MSVTSAAVIKSTQNDLTKDRLLWLTVQSTVHRGGKMAAGAAGAPSQLLMLHLKSRSRGEMDAGAQSTLSFVFSSESHRMVVSTVRVGLPHQVTRRRISLTDVPEGLSPG